MRKSYVRATMLATASLQFLVASQAFAEDGGSDDSIIVTARRIEEKLQDVPISISVVSQERLTNANISSAEDLSRVVPGLNTQSRYSSEQTIFAIRGFGQESRTSASVGTYFGDVVAPRSGGLSLPGGDGAGPGSLFDLQSVQVLKGPQGTLFGRNTTGGAVLLVPRKPTDKFEGYVEASYGNFDAMRFQGVVNLPISSGARLRLGADYRNADGYMKNVSGIGPKDFGNVNYIALRASLALDLSPNIENYTIFSYLHSDTNGTPAQIYRANPALALGALAKPQVDRLNASDDPWQIEQKLQNPETKTESWQVINTTTLHASDDITIKNIMSYSSYIQDVRQDVFSGNFQVAALQAWVSSAFAFHPAGFHTNDQRNFTEELQIQGTGAGGKLKYQAGLYYERSSPGGPISSAAPGVGATCLISVVFTTIDEMRCRNGTVTPQVGKIWFTNMAAYAQATYALTEQFKITAGLRYTYDRTRGESTGMTYTFSNAGIGYNVGAGQTFVAPRFLSCTPGFAAPNCTFSGKSSDNAPTWTLNLQYSPTDRVMLYATYSRGYRQGATTPFSATGFPQFNAEKVDNFELGMKATFDGAVSGNFSLAGFYSKLSNQQLQIGLQDTTSTLPNATSILNAGRSRIYGIELDGFLRFGKVLRLDASLAYIDSKLVSISVPPTPGYNVIIPSALAGDPLPYTPKWGINLAATITLPTGDNIGKIDLTAAYRYNSPFASAASSTNPAVFIPVSSSVKQLDLNLDWRGVAGSTVDLGIFANNVTNQLTWGVVVPIFSQAGYDARYLGRPRTYGARIRFRFGN